MYMCSECMVLDHVLMRVAQFYGLPIFWQKSICQLVMYERGQVDSLVHIHSVGSLTGLACIKFSNWLQTLSGQCSLIAVPNSFPIILAKGFLCSMHSCSKLHTLLYFGCRGITIFFS